ncbi:MAG: hypothetical protein MUC85_10245 [Anaerolineales bacterium]|nr:hypothetical protein [Anaerolineales bacterium]
MVKAPVLDIRIRRRVAFQAHAVNGYRKAQCGVSPQRSDLKLFCSIDLLALIPPPGRFTFLPRPATLRTLGYQA